MELLVSKRRSYYRDIVDIWSTGVSKYSLERLAHADVFNSIGLERRKALWEVMSLADKPVPILASQTGEGIEEKKIVLPQMQASEHVVQDYASTSLSLTAFCFGPSVKRSHNFRVVGTCAA